MTWQIFFAGIGFGFLAVVAIGLAYIAIVFAVSWWTINLKRHRGAPDHPSFWRTEINRYQFKHAGVAGPWKTVWGSHPILKVFGLSDAVRGRWFLGWLRFDARVHTDEKDLIPQCRNAGRYLAETNDGRLLYLNHANEWQEMPNILAASPASPSGPEAVEPEALAKPASEPASGDGAFCVYCANRRTYERDDGEIFTCKHCKPTHAMMMASGPETRAYAKAALSSSAGPAVAKRWLVEEHLATGSIRWACYEHELQARNVAGAYDGRATVTPLYAHPAPATVEMRDALKDCAQWLDVILAEKVVVEPENERHIAASVARARAALAPATEAKGD